ncbi:Fc.00g091050.m01.CDS01 [Cosmosporella sp. VM-42]
MTVVRQLWDAGIRIEFAAKVKPKLLQQFNAPAISMPLAAILGRDEPAAGQVRLKDVRAGDKEAEQKHRGRLIPRQDPVEEVKK